MIETGVEEKTGSTSMTKKHHEQGQGQQLVSKTESPDLLFPFQHVLAKMNDYLKKVDNISIWSFIVK